MKTSCDLINIGYSTISSGLWEMASEIFFIYIFEEILLL